MTFTTLSGSSGEDYISFKSEPGDHFFSTGSAYSQDLVNSPAHYTVGSIECIDAIEASSTKEAFRGYLKGCAQKYIWRYEKKGNAKQDLQKANWYLDRLISTYDTITFS